MMRKTGIFLAAAVSVASLGVAAQAASLGLTVDPEPLITATGDLQNFGFGLDFQDPTFSSGAGTGTLSAYTGLAVALTADLQTDGTIGAFGGSFNVDDLSGIQVANSSSLVAFGSVYDPAGADTLEFQFDGIGGDESGAFPNGVLLTLTGEFGADLAETFTLADMWAGNGLTDVSLVIAPISAPGVVPLPAAAVLLLAGVASLALYRRT